MVLARCCVHSLVLLDAMHKPTLLWLLTLRMQLCNAVPQQWCGYRPVCEHICWTLHRCL
jgi:hypothetical protein